MIYVPNYVDTNCAYIYNSDIIRVYDSVPQADTSVNYKDYFVNFDYNYNEGTTTFSQFSTLPVCISSDRITTDVYYRNDISQIFIIFSVLVVFVLLLPLKIFSRLFRRYI